MKIFTLSLLYFSQGQEHLANITICLSSLTITMRPVNSAWCASSKSRSRQHLLEILGNGCKQHIKKSICDTHLGPAKNQNNFRKGTRASNHDPSHHNLLSQRKDSTRRCLEGLRWVKPHKMPPHPVNALSLSHKNSRNELSNLKQDAYDSCESQAMWFPFSSSLSTTLMYKVFQKAWVHLVCDY